MTDAQYEYLPAEEEQKSQDGEWHYHGKSRVPIGEEYNRACPSKHLPHGLGGVSDPFAFFRRYFKKERESS